MSSYVMRWCKNHGDWEEDVDNPEEACPECVAQGWTIPREKLLEENAKLKRQLAEARRCIFYKLIQGNYIHGRWVYNGKVHGNCEDAIDAAIDATGGNDG